MSYKIVISHKCAMDCNYNNSTMIKCHTIYIYIYIYIYISFKNMQSHTSQFSSHYMLKKTPRVQKKARPIRSSSNLTMGT